MGNSTVQGIRRMPVNPDFTRCRRRGRQSPKARAPQAEVGRGPVDRVDHGTVAIELEFTRGFKSLLIAQQEEGREKVPRATCEFQHVRERRGGRGARGRTGRYS